MEEPKALGILWIVRHYDGFDYTWMDVTKPLPRAEAEAEYAKLTAGGTKNTCFNDIDYYEIFPADTKMLFREETRR